MSASTNKPEEKQVHFLDGLAEIAAAKPAKNPNLVRRKKKKEKRKAGEISDAKAASIVREIKLSVPGGITNKKRRTGSAPIKLSKKPVGTASQHSARDPRKATGSRKDPETHALYSKLVAYGRNATLSHYLEEMKFDLSPSRLRKMTKNKLKEELEAVQADLGVAGEDRLFNSTLKNAMVWMEGLLAARTRVNAVGATDDCFGDEQWIFQLERLKMEMGVGMGSGRHPAFELALMTAYAAHVRHMKNGVDLTPQTDLNLEV